MKRLKKQKGQTLIEALVALGAAVLVLSAIAVAVISALNNAQYAKNQDLATQYASQGIEVMRQLSQTNWTTFLSYNSGKYCLAKDEALPCLAGSQTGSCIQSGGLVACTPNYGIFVREVDIGQNSNSCSNNALITVIVSWSDSKCTSSGNTYCHKVSLNSCLSNHNSNVQSL